jgi:hypothetical protein
MLILDLLSVCRFTSRADLVQWTALAIANLATELRLSIELGQANCCEVLVQVKLPVDVAAAVMLRGDVLTTFFLC